MVSCHQGCVIYLPRSGACRLLFVLWTAVVAAGCAHRSPVDRPAASFAPAAVFTAQTIGVAEFRGEVFASAPLFEQLAPMLGRGSGMWGSPVMVAEARNIELLTFSFVEPGHGIAQAFGLSPSSFEYGNGAVRGIDKHRMAAILASYGSGEITEVEVPGGSGLRFGEWLVADGPDGWVLFGPEPTLRAFLGGQRQPEPDVSWPEHQGVIGPSPAVRVAVGPFVAGGQQVHLALAFDWASDFRLLFAFGAEDETTLDQTLLTVQEQARRFAETPFWRLFGLRPVDEFVQFRRDQRWAIADVRLGAEECIRLMRQFRGIQDLVREHEAGEQGVSLQQP